MAPPTVKMETKPTLGVENNHVDLTNTDINQELNNEFEFVGNIDYLKSKSRFGEEVLGRRCLVLFDTKPEPKQYKPKSYVYKGRRKKKRKRPRRKGTVPASGRVVGFRKQMVDENETDLEKIDFEIVHLIKFDEKQGEEKDDEEETEWWMDLSDLRDRGELFWEDHVVQRVAVKRRKKKKVVAKVEPTPQEGKNAEGKEPQPEPEPELPPEIAELVANPKWPVGSEVFWHLMQPTKPGEELHPYPDPTGKLTQLPQPTGLDLTGIVEEVPNKENDYRYKVSLPGEFQASVLLHPNAILKGKKPKRKRKPRTERPAKRPKIPTLPWIQSMAEWMISVPTSKSEKAAARVMTRKSANIVVAKAKLLSSGKGIAYGKWTANAAGDDEHSRNLTVFYKDQPLADLKEYDYETVRSDGAAHELLYGKDDSAGWLYSYTLTKIHQFQQYCIHHDLDMENPPARWQDLPGSQEPEPLPEPTPRSPRKKKENGKDATAKKSPPTTDKTTPEATDTVAASKDPVPFHSPNASGNDPNGTAALAAAAAAANKTDTLVASNDPSTAGNAAAAAAAAKKKIQSSPIQRKKKPSPRQQQQSHAQPSRGKQMRLPIQRNSQPAPRQQQIHEQQQQIHQQQQHHQQQLLFEAAASLMEQHQQQQYHQPPQQMQQYPQQQYHQPTSQSIQQQYPPQNTTYGQQQQQQPGQSAYPYNLQQL